MPKEFLNTSENDLTMGNPNIDKIEDLRISQIIDANLDRAREGLRVLEDWPDLV